jgi:hypothetical protein
MKIKIVFDDNSSKELTYTGNWEFPQWSEYFFSARYYVLNKSSNVGNLAIDTYKVKYLELV